MEPIPPLEEPGIQLLKKSPFMAEDSLPSCLE
jgi:hypothetical protein